MIQKELLMVDYFESEFKGKFYKISKFFDVDSGQFYTGTDIGLDKSSVGEMYNCYLEYKNKKMTVTKVD